MPGNQFIIRERPDLGGFFPRNGTPTVFYWDVEHRNIPIKPWTVSLQQRTVRIDYPGNDLPTEQVLGPNYEPMTFSGKWLDKFNPRATRQDDETLFEFANRSVGYATQEYTDFEAMFRRGNKIEISFEDWMFVGLITDFRADRNHSGDISYEFTFSPHSRVGVTDELQLTLVQTPKDASTVAFELAKDKEKILESDHTLAPVTLLQGNISFIVGDTLDEFAAGVDAFSSAVDQRVLAQDTDAKLSIARVINAADVIITKANEAITETATLDASTGLAHRGDAVGELCFEDWQRSLRSSLREAIFNTWEARQQLDQEADPEALALYRPHKNESLYSISRRFYGTPFQWQLIAERNRLKSSNLTGTELLIIPEVPIR